MSSDVFEAVAAEGTGRRGYRRELHQRVDKLVEEWLSRNSPSARSGTDALDEQVQNCSAWVSAEYQQRFGIPVIGWLLWPVISGLIRWLVQRTLERMFPRTGGRNGSGA